MSVSIQANGFMHPEVAWAGTRLVGAVSPSGQYVDLGRGLRQSIEENRAQWRAAMAARYARREAAKASKAVAA